MSRRNLSLQRRCDYWLEACLRLGCDKAQLPALEKLFWTYKPWKGENMHRRGLTMAVAIGKLAEVQERERAAATTQHRT